LFQAANLLIFPYRCHVVYSPSINPRPLPLSASFSTFHNL
jgi:hypothetical protein